MYSCFEVSQLPVDFGFSPFSVCLGDTPWCICLRHYAFWLPRLGLIPLDSKHRTRQPNMFFAVFILQAQVHPFSILQPCCECLYYITDALKLGSVYVCSCIRVVSLSLCMWVSFSVFCALSISVVSLSFSPSATHSHIYKCSHGNMTF